MAQNDFSLANAAGAVFRADVNSALQALASSSSGSSEPSTTYPWQPWGDTGTDILKIRNDANDAWIELFPLDQTADTVDISAFLAVLGFSAFFVTLAADTTAGAALATLTAAGQGKQTIWVPAGAMTARTTSGAAAGTTESTTNKVMLSTMDFDASTQEFAQFTVAFPNSWNEGTITFIPCWTAASSSGGVVFGLAGVALSNDDAIDTAFGTAQTSTDTLIATTDIHWGPESASITIAGTPAAGDLTVFQVNRTVANGSDTLGADAKLIGIKLLFTTNAATDA